MFSPEMRNSRDKKRIEPEELEALRKTSSSMKRKILEIVYKKKTGHIGGSFSCIDILLVLYFFYLSYKPDDPKWEKRDILILSKGHASLALYLVLQECGFFPERELDDFGDFDSLLEVHPTIEIPGVEATTGSLGQGLSTANGLALAARLDNNPKRIVVLIGDGECQEGQIWEAALSATKYNLASLTAIVDCNRYQQDDSIDSIKPFGSIKAKWESFDWNVLEVNGHDYQEIVDALHKPMHKPKAIIAHTVKGKGVSFMQGSSFHSKIPNREEIGKALDELS